MKNTTDYDEVIESLDSGNNVFITGSAGSGKTYLASEFAKNTSNCVGITATTGIAALNIGGETIHRFLGLGIATRPFEAGKIIGKWRKISTSSKPWDKARWNLMQKLDTIIIDEVSMLRRDQFELIDTVLSFIKDCPLPFGGVQMVLVGDFLQLPPVVTPSDKLKFKDLSRPFCFQSDIWRYAKFDSYNLSLNYRQGDSNFLSSLEKIRTGTITSDTNKIFKSRVDSELNTTLKPVKLFPHKGTARDENIECLNDLPGKKFSNKAEFFGKNYDVEILRKECQADDKLFYCLDAQVMMLTNDVESRWVNGTMGTIESINPLKVRLSNNNIVNIDLHTWERINHKVSGEKVETSVVATMRQYPFKLAYATTIHKSQGLTLDYLDIDIAKCFTDGQAYVALSRAKTLDGIKLRSWNAKAISAAPEVLKFYGLNKDRGEPSLINEWGDEPAW